MRETALRLLTRAVVCSCFAAVSMIPFTTTASATDDTAIAHVAVDANGKLTITGGFDNQALRLYANEDTDEYVIREMSFDRELAADDPGVCYNASPVVVRCARDSVTKYTIVLGPLSDAVEMYPDWDLAGKLFLGGGNDIVYMSGNRWTTIDGGPGADDQVSFAFARHAITASLDGVQNDGIIGNPKINLAPNIENLNGGPYDDVLTGSDQSNYIDAGGGGDEIYGLGRADVLQGSGGTDLVDGGDKIDTCYGEIRINCERGS